MPFKPPAQKKCPTCSKTAYPAESITYKDNLYHKQCFKCCECGLKLTLTTVRVSDFGENGVYCQKCVPKVAPSQAAQSVETDRTSKAAQLTKDVRIVNEQVRGAEDTVGKATHSVPS
eukprot:m.44386 g.44386  ORF g.44386 m.44386 type:complete len:117 (+) comp11701_c0_seq1:133-483(+)